MSQPRYSLRTQRDEWYYRIKESFCDLQIECAACHDEVCLIDELNHLLALGTEVYAHHGRELGSMRACQRQSGMESPRFLYLYKVAPSRRLSTQKADTTEATNALGEVVFVNPNEHRQAFLELCHSEKAKSTRRMKSMVQMRLCS